jgi:hypothetical protein
MAKKSAEKGILAKYAPKIMSLILSIPEENSESFLKKFNNTIHFKRFLIRYATFFILLLAALIVILDGMGLLFGSMLPNLRPGITHIIIGLLLIVAVIVYRKI